MGRKHKNFTESGADFFGVNTRTYKNGTKERRIHHPAVLMDSYTEVYGKNGKRSIETTEPNALGIPERVRIHSNGKKTYL